MWIVLNYLQRQLAHSNSHTSEVRKNLTDLYVLALLYHSRRACDLNTETSEEETDRFPRYATAVAPLACAPAVYIFLCTQNLYTSSAPLTLSRALSPHF